MLWYSIVRGHLSKKFGGLESATVYVLVADNKLDFYKIVEKTRCAEIAASIALDVLKLESESICAVKQLGLAAAVSAAKKNANLNNFRNECW